MKSFTNMELEVWTDGERDMMAIHADMPKESEGLKHIWFVMTRQELTDVVNNKIDAVTDITHRLNAFGDMWIFYDIEIPREGNGVMKVPFHVAHFPKTFQRTMLRFCTRIWETSKQIIRFADENKMDSWWYKSNRIRIPVSQKLRDMNERLFGQGKGEVKLNFGDYKAEETEARFKKLLSEGDKTFVRSFQSMEGIARNSTSGFHQKATLNIYKDGEDFSWTAISPRGNRIMNGGLINHGRRTGTQDWSVHT